MSYASKDKSAKTRQAIWIFTIVFAVVAIIISISCLLIYLLVLDQSFSKGHSKSQEGEVTEGVTIEAEVICTPLSCEPQCLTEWYEGNFTCELGASVGPVDYRQRQPTKV